MNEGMVVKCRRRSDGLSFRDNMWLYKHLFTHFSSVRCIPCRVATELTWPLYLFAAVLMLELGMFLAR
jgi:hypothetical protein